MAQISQTSLDLTDPSDTSKSDQIIYRVYYKLCLLIYQARSSTQELGSGRIDKWFNLQTPDVSLFREDTHPYRHLSTVRPMGPFQVKVLLEIPPLSQHEVFVYSGDPHSSKPVAIDPPPLRMLLETWTINYSIATSKPDDYHPPQVYKQGISLFRSIFTLLRTMPCWRLDTRLTKLSRGTSGHKFSIIVQTGHGDFSQSQPTDLPHDSHILPPMKHINGYAHVSARWLHNPNFQVMDRAAYASSQFEELSTERPTVANLSLGNSLGSPMRRRLLLNNLLQRTYGIHALNMVKKGPSYKGLWEVIVYVNDVEYGRSTNPQAELAAELAAREAYDRLRELIAQEDPSQGYVEAQISRSTNTFPDAVHMRSGTETDSSRATMAISAPPVLTSFDTLTRSVRHQSETKTKQYSSPVSQLVLSDVSASAVTNAPSHVRHGVMADEDRLLMNMRHFQSSGDPMITTMLKLVVTGRVDQDVLLVLVDEDAQYALDAIQDLLDKGPYRPLDIALTNESLDLPHRLRRLQLKLVLRCDKLPRALFLSDVRVSSTDNFGTFGGFSDIFDGLYGTQRVAVKRLRVFQFMEPSKRDAVKQSFYHEAITWRSLVHRHILPFIGIDNKLFPPSLCMVSPWMERGTVRHTMDNLKTIEGISDDVLFTYVQRWTLETVLGLAYLHGENVVHGDLRCANILIDSDMEVRLADFRLSVFADGASNHYASVRAGATKWLAPEVIDPEEFDMKSSRPTFMSDVYSYACVIIELYTGSAPFAELSEHTVIRRIMQGLRPGRPLFHGGEIMSDALWDIVSQCWRHSPSDRPTAKAVVEKLLATQFHSHET